MSGVTTAGFLLLLRDRVPHVRDERRMNRLHNLQPNLSPLDPVEQADPIAKEDRCQGDGKFVNQASIEVLEDGVASSCDPDVLVACGLTCLPQRTLNSIVDEVEGGPARAFPRIAFLLGQDKDRRMERGFLRPATFSAVEHPLPHNAHARTLEGFLRNAVVLAGLTTLAKLQILAFDGAN